MDREKEIGKKKERKQEIKKFGRYHGKKEEEEEEEEELIGTN
jgi:hypothetical protein